MNSILSVELVTDFDDERPVFVSGNFCDWQPNRPEFRMKKVDAGKYAFQFPKEFKNFSRIEYKYNKGGWEHVELDFLGNSPANRVLSNTSGTLQDFVPFWRNSGSTAFKKNLMPQVHLISEEFTIPQLSKSRKIHILLPHNYYQEPEKRFPVLYMQDAQNLFGEGSAYGNWEIDKRLSLLANQGKGEVIVVAIEHGEEQRFNEYSPYKYPQKGKGQGMKYANFIVRTLKPYIDANYRTKPERQNTGIGGSSMGGLISIYAGFMYPEELGKLMIFSPSLWVSPKIYFDSIEFFSPLETKIYLYAGGHEGATMIPNVEKLKSTIEKQGWDVDRIQMKLSIDPLGEHNEKRWGQEFPKAIEWLF